MKIKRKGSAAWQGGLKDALDPAKELQKLGGANAILRTRRQGDSAAGQRSVRARKALDRCSRPGPDEIVPITLHSGRSIAGWPSGVARDSEGTLNFSESSGVRPVVEVSPLSQVRDAYQRMITGKVHFRAVLKAAE